MMLIIAALAFKAVVPSGFMVTSPEKMTLQVIVCSPSAPGGHTLMSVPVEKDSKAPENERANGQPCTFSTLNQMLIGGADALLLALAIAFILLLGHAPQIRRVFAMPQRIRPPLRAPPVTA